MAYYVLRNNFNKRKVTINTNKTIIFFTNIMFLKAQFSAFCFRMYWSNTLENQEWKKKKKTKKNRRHVISWYTRQTKQYNTIKNTKKMSNDDSIKTRGELRCVIYDTHQVTHTVKTRWANYIRTQTNNINKTWPS
jgi:hypothetical protein